MKTTYLFILAMLVSAASFSQTYYTYTATKSGSWNDMSIWNIVPRTDGVAKTEAVIPSPYVITADNGVNSLGLGDIQIIVGGTLSVLPSTTLIFTNGSTIQLTGAGNVLGTNNTEKITIGGVTKYDGSIDHTKTGASTASSVTGVSPNGFTLTLLPVVFNSFTAAKNGSAVILNWSTASEVSNDYFGIERSYNGNDWSAIATIQSNGFASSYSYTDNNANDNIIYYRLKQVDIDGAFVYSTVKTINGANTAAAKIYGTGKTINIELNTTVRNNVTVTVMNTAGQVMQKQQFNAGYKITMSENNASTEILIVHITDGNTLNQTAKLML